MTIPPDLRAGGSLFCSIMVLQPGSPKTFSTKRTNIRTATLQFSKAAYADQRPNATRNLGNIILQINRSQIQTYNFMLVHLITKSIRVRLNDGYGSFKEYS